MASLKDTRRIVDTVFGAMAAEVLFTAARLGVADLIGERESTGAALAADCNTDPASFTRLLRAMAAMGLLTEPAPGRFRLTEAGALLRSGHPESLRSFVQMFGDPAMLGAWRELETAVRTGQTTFDKVYGTNIFEYLAQRPELSAQFNAAMRQGTMAIAQNLPSSYDFTRFHTVADVGGGDGTRPVLRPARLRLLRFHACLDMTRLPRVPNGGCPLGRVAPSRKSRQTTKAGLFLGNAPSSSVEICGR